jgi:hypothetical protein
VVDEKPAYPRFQTEDTYFSLAIPVFEETVVSSDITDPVVDSLIEW